MADEGSTEQDQASDEDIASQVSKIIEGITAEGDLVLPENCTPQLLLALSKEVISQKNPAVKNPSFDMCTSGLKEIPSRAFSGTGCEMIRLPSSLQSVSEGALLGCPVLCEISFCSKLQKSTWEQLIGALEASFKEEPRTIALVLSRYFDEQEAKWLVDSLRGRFIAGLQVDFSELSFVPAKALSDCLCVGEICFSHTLRAIGRAAFSGCANLTRISFIDCGIQRKQWREIFGALRSHSMLDIMLPPGMEQQEFEEFAEELTASNMKDVNVYIQKAAFTQIPDETFSGCTALRNIEISPRITSVGPHAFDDCPALRGIYTDCGIEIALWRQLVASTERLPGVRFVLPVGVTTQEVADLITALRESDAQDIGVDLQQTQIENIPAGFFADCWALGLVCLPYGFKKIGEGVFKECRNLNFIYSPEPLDEERWCELLRAAGDVFGVNVRVPDKTREEDLKPFANALRKNPAFLVQIDMRGANIRSIPNGTFADCKSVIKFSIPAKVEKIGQGAFLGCTNLSEAGVLMVDLHNWCTDPECTAKIPTNRLSRVILKGNAVYKGRRLSAESEKKILSKVQDAQMGFRGK